MHLEDEKGTYWKITDRSKEDILEDVLLELRRIILPFKRQGKVWEMIVDSINRDSTKAAKGGRLCKFYVIWKLHKAANAIGLRSRPIAAAIDYVTGPASHFLHTQLKEAVWKHPHVLKDSMELIRTVEGMHFDSSEQIMLTAADVNALYPSIQLERGMAALKWFMDHHTDLGQTIKDLYLKLAYFVLKTTTLCVRKWDPHLPPYDWNSDGNYIFGYLRCNLYDMARDTNSPRWKVQSVYSLV